MTANHIIYIDLTSYCTNLRPGAHLVVFSKGSFTIVKIVPPDCKVDDTDGTSHTFPTSDDSQVVGDILTRPGIPIHELAGIDPDLLIRSVVESARTSLN